MKKILKLALVAGVLAVAPMSAYAVLDSFTAVLLGNLLLREGRAVSDSVSMKNDLKARQSELTMKPEERQARDEAMKQTFDQLSAHLPESEREAEKDRLLERYMSLAPQHPSVTERLDILRDEAAAQKMTKTVQ